MKGNEMASKLTTLVNIYDDKIETTNEKGNLFTRYEVVEAGTHPDALYKSVMVDILLEIQHMLELGCEVVIVDRREVE